MISNELAVRQAVADYCTVGHRFYMSELTDWVRAKLGGYVAPDSPGRRLRELRQQGKLTYNVRNHIFEVFTNNA